MSPNRVLRSPQRRRAERGVVLIDVLVAVVVFAVGVLAVMALQATAVQQSSQAKYRADATMLANALISRMWLTDRQVATLSATFIAGNAAYDEWLASVGAALPGAAENPPVVTVDSVAGGAGAPNTARVTVQMRWRPPSSAVGAPVNQLVMVTQIR
jgi:type IV pilus assembly protein PilV